MCCRNESANSVQSESRNQRIGRSRLHRCNLVFALIQWPAEIIIPTILFPVGGFCPSFFEADGFAAGLQNSSNYERFHRHLPAM